MQIETELKPDYFASVEGAIVVLHFQKDTSIIAKW